ncbi:MAG TPA: histidinol dehydrogenase [Chloroflexota bacterium]|nr:histidinol dehydrogenase [Chloroflexota bacterium]
MINLRTARSLQEGRRLLLAHRGLDELSAPPGLAARIQTTFGEPLTPGQVVERIVTAVKAEGDVALERYCRLIDGSFPRPLIVDRSEMEAARRAISPELLSAFQTSAERILAFHRKALRQSWFETSPSGSYGQIVRPLSRVGLYVPGGTAAYPSSLLMSALPAKAAGVQDVIVTTPPARDGSVPAVVLAAADVAGVSAVYRVGGAQAIAAMAYGTETIPRVEKILGPGNLFVALAKRMVAGTVGIDAITGPTETLIVADDSTPLEHVAADLLAQAEHDVLAQAVLITTSSTLLDGLPAELERQLAGLSRASIARESMEGRGVAVLVSTLDEALELANEYAPEHLCLEVEEPWSVLDSVRAAGGVFLGTRSIEALGDYVAGPSPVMPTGGSARFSSPLTVDDFLKVSSLFAVSEEGLRTLGPAAVLMARSEGLDAHAASVQRRLDERIRRGVDATSPDPSANANSADEGM